MKTPRWFWGDYAGLVAKKTDTRSERAPINRIERALAYAAASVVGLGVVCIVITLVGAASGIVDRTTGIWPAVTVLPVIAFPIGIFLVIAYVVVSVVRRGRETRIEIDPRGTRR